MPTAGREAGPGVSASAISVFCTSFASFDERLAAFLDSSASFIERLAAVFQSFAFSFQRFDRTFS